MTPSSIRTTQLTRLAIMLAAIALLPPTAHGQEPEIPSGLRLEKILDGEGVGRVTGLVDPKDGTNRLFIVQQSGEIRILENGILRPKPFLDVANKVQCCDNERGLVGLEFHPDYENNGFFYTVYVDLDDRTVVSRWTVSADPNAADTTSRQTIIRWNQPDLPHNGGAINFGIDGYLYVAAGDGGARQTAQDLESLLGSILRLDVDSAFPYAIPEDNPFVGVPDALDEIWVWGLRNPWRFTFDRRTGDMYIGDVGAATFEEINFQPAGSGGGENFGWSVLEGSRCIAGEGAAECADESLTAPIILYSHKEGTCNSVTGGYRYRGPRVPTLPGLYVYGDFCRGDIWGARRNQAGNWVVNELLQSGLLITTFAEDSKGNLYLAHFRGDIYRLVGQELFASDFEAGDALDWTQRRGDVAVVDGGLKRSEHALEISVGGGKSFVRSKHPSSETTFHVGFDFNANNVNLANGGAEVLRLAGGGKRGHLRLILEEIGGDYFLGLLLRADSGGFQSLGRTVVPAKRTVRVELDWLAASAPGANDGEVSLSKNGKVRVAVANLDTDRKKISAVTVGPSGSTGGSGSILVDNYVSTP